jgi:RimJ/RimL family protein N-acetyltransferase
MAARRERPEEGGERDLERLLAALEARLDPEAYHFAAVAAPDDVALGRARGLFREREGWTAVLGANDGGLQAETERLPWARIELTVHSSLEAVGLIAAVAARLAAEGIPVNPWSGRHHDHLFVPWARRDEALEALDQLQRSALERQRRREAAPEVTLEAGVCRLRAFRPGDEVELAAAADDVEVARWLRDRFPHPYTIEHARAWIASVRGEEPPPRSLAIEVDGAVAGGVGLVLGDDIARRAAEIGYWLARRHWGRGIATAAVARFVEWAMPAFGLTRIFAAAFAENIASRRVLEKAGFRLEGIQRRAAVKHGRILDDAVYAITDEDLARGGNRGGSPAV